MTLSSFRLRKPSTGSSVRPTGDDGALRSTGYAPAVATPEGVEFSVRATSHTSVFVEWGVPVDIVWTELLIVRSDKGVPLFPDDGTIVFRVTEARPYSSGNDLGLTPGGWYYYTLFIRRDPDTLPVYTASAWDTELVPFDHGMGDWLFDRVPEYYRDLDLQLAQAASSERGPLQRYLDVLGFELDGVRTRADAVSTIRDVDVAPAHVLPYHAQLIGVEYEPELGDVRMRALLSAMPALRQSKGTETAYLSWIAAATGYQLSFDLYPSGLDLNILVRANRTNLLLNPTFGDGEGDWTVTRTGGSHTYVPAEDGRQTLRVSGASALTLLSPVFPTEYFYAGGLFYDSLQERPLVASFSATAPPDLIEFVFYDDGADLGLDEEATIRTTVPVTTYPIIVPNFAGMTDAALRCTWNSPPATLDLRSFIVECAPEVGAYFDGNSNTGGPLDYRWGPLGEHRDQSFYNRNFQSALARMTDLSDSLLPATVREPWANRPLIFSYDGVTLAAAT